MNLRLPAAPANVCFHAYRTSLTTASKEVGLVSPMSRQTQTPRMQAHDHPQMETRRKPRVFYFVRKAGVLGALGLMAIAVGAAAQLPSLPAVPGVPALPVGASQDVATPLGTTHVAADQAGAQLCMDQAASTGAVPLPVALPVALPASGDAAASACANADLTTMTVGVDAKAGANASAQGLPIGDLANAGLAGNATADAAAQSAQAGASAHVGFLDGIAQFFAKLFAWL
jgi:hypothetical protein